MTNKHIASLFDELANIMEIAGENPFKIRAFRNASKAIVNLDRNVEEMNREELHEIPGIGDAISEKIESAKESGTFPTLEKWRQSGYAKFYPLLSVSGLTAREVHKLIKDLSLSFVDELRAQIADGKLENYGKIDSGKLRRLREYLDQNSRK